jgi:tyrocidine synthetase III
MYGKIDKKALPLPEDLDGAESTIYMAPENETEEKLVLIWSEILEVDREKIGVTHNFFDLGGHSLKAIRIALRIHEHFDVEIDLTDFFNDPTIRALAEEIDNLKWMKNQDDFVSEASRTIV